MPCTVQVLLKRTRNDKLTKRPTDREAAVVRGYNEILGSQLTSNAVGESFALTVRSSDSTETWYPV